jgi:hypothetical protein
MPRFVILRHEMPPQAPRGLHWDLMFEVDGYLRTWSIDRELTPDVELDAEELADHRIAYLDYEGPVSHDRGTVSRYDSGNYDLREHGADVWLAEMRGQRLGGQISLRRRGPASHSWRVSFTAAPTRG